jgi:putative cell wall-binding protein
LLTPTDSLPTSVSAEIQRLGPSRIYILGGTAVISANVANQLEALLP